MADLKGYFAYQPDIVVGLAIHMSEPGFQRPRFVTIDNLLELATKLVDGLNKLGKRRHLLEARRGARNVDRGKQSEMLKATSKTYFFEIKKQEKVNLA